MKSILIWGNDPALVGVRAKVLELATFRISTACTIEQGQTALEESPPDILLICSSFGYGDRLFANQWTAKRFPGKPTVTLLRSGDPQENFAGKTLSIEDGPGGLIDAVCGMAAYA